MAMRVKRLKIRGFMGIEELDVTPGQHATVIEGGNGKGKSSILNAIRLALGGGNDAEVIRNGQSQAEVVLEFEGGELGEVSKVFRRDTTPLVTIKDAEGRRKNQTWLNGLFDRLSFNPVEILAMSPRERADAILKALRLPFDPAALSAVTGERDWSHLADENAIVALDAARSAIYNERVPVNIDIDRCKRTIQQLEQTLPPADEAGTDPARLGELEKQMQALLVESRTIQQSGESAKLQKAAEIRATFAKRVEEIDERISHIKLELLAAENDRKQVAVEQRTALEQLEAKAKSVIAERTSDVRQRIAALERDIIAERANGEKLMRYKVTRETIEQNRVDLADKEVIAETMTGYLKAIDRLKADQLGRLPIKGLTIENGEIQLDGVPFEKVNKARQIQFCMAIAKLRAGDLPIVLLDGLEQFDEKTWGEFEKAAAKLGLEMFVTRVTDGPLVVRSV